MLVKHVVVHLGTFYRRQMATYTIGAKLEKKKKKKLACLAKQPPKRMGRFLLAIVFTTYGKTVFMLLAIEINVLREPVRERWSKPVQEKCNRKAS